MSSRLFILSFFGVLLLQISGCNRAIDEVNLVQREGVYFKSGSNQPYSGDIVAYYASGEVEYKFSLKEGVRQGVFQRFFKDGRLHIETNYSEGIRNGKYRDYHVNGRLSSDYQISAGEIVMAESFRETGELLYRQTTIGEQTELHEWFYEDGSHNYTYTTKAGVQNGLYLEFDEYYGEVKHRQCYKEGAKVDIIICDSE